jgi:hypothetical protein
MLTWSHLRFKIEPTDFSFRDLLNCCSPIASPFENNLWCVCVGVKIILLSWFQWYKY